MITINKEECGHRHLAANEFRDALVTAPPGTPIVYFVGELSYARYLAAFHRDPGLPELTLLVKMAMDGSDAGELALTQRRLAPHRFEYLATKVRPEFQLERRAALKRAA